MGCCSKRRDSNPHILMVGLEGSGKTTILYQLERENKVHSIPTIGFNIETLV